MKIDVASCISSILYQQDTVVVPGLGSFSSAYKPATVDYVQGIIFPPSRQLAFSPECAAGDDSLIKALLQKYALSTEEAAITLRDFARQTKEALDNKEVVMLPKIGRLYKGHETIQFIQDTTNYYLKGYGLPSAHFFPIIRQEEKPTPLPLPLNSTPEQILKPVPLRGRLLPLFIPILFAAALTVVGFSLFISQKNKEVILGIQRLPAELHLNKKPETVLQEETTARVDKPEQRSLASMIPMVQEKGGSVEGEYGSPVDTEGPTLAPNQHECVIIIGQFSKKEGVSKRVNEIYEIGFNAYTAVNPKNNLTMVGVQFIYEDPDDVHKALTYLRRRFESSAWVLKPQSF